MEMSKAATIRLLHSERCSPAEIALAVGYREKIIVLRLAKPRPLAHERIGWEFGRWRGWPLSDKVVSF